MNVAGMSKISKKRTIKIIINSEIKKYNNNKILDMQDEFKLQ